MQILFVIITNMDLNYKLQSTKSHMNQNSVNL